MPGTHRAMDVRRHRPSSSFPLKSPCDRWQMFVCRAPGCGAMPNPQPGRPETQDIDSAEAVPSRRHPPRRRRRKPHKAALSHGQTKSRGGYRVAPRRSLAEGTRPDAVDESPDRVHLEELHRGRGVKTIKSAGPLSVPDALRRGKKLTWQLCACTAHVQFGRFWRNLPCFFRVFGPLRGGKGILSPQRLPFRHSPKYLPNKNLQHVALPGACTILAP
jgi:hypothetical protein